MKFAPKGHSGVTAGLAHLLADTDADVRKAAVEGILACAQASAPAPAAPPRARAAAMRGAEAGAGGGGAGTRTR